MAEQNKAEVAAIGHVEREPVKVEADESQPLADGDKLGEMIGIENELKPTDAKVMPEVKPAVSEKNELGVQAVEVDMAEETKPAKPVKVEPVKAEAAVAGNEILMVDIKDEHKPTSPSPLSHVVAAELAKLPSSDAVETAESKPKHMAEEKVKTELVALVAEDVKMGDSKPALKVDTAAAEAKEEGETAEDAGDSEDVKFGLGKHKLEEEAEDGVEAKKVKVDGEGECARVAVAKAEEGSDVKDEGCGLEVVVSATRAGVITKKVDKEEGVLETE